VAVERHAAIDRQVLELAGPGVGGAGEDEDQLLLALQEGSERLAAEVGVDGDCLLYTSDAADE